MTNGDGKTFEFTTGGLFVPLSGEYSAEPTPPEVALAVDVRPLFVTDAAAVHFQKDFNRTMKMNPLDGERIKAREKNSNRVTFRFGARVSATGEDS